VILAWKESFHDVAQGRGGLILTARESRRWIEETHGDRIQRHGAAREPL
jgi:hypothetical protein